MLTLGQARFGPASVTHYLRDRADLYARLEEKAGRLPWRPEQFNPYPFLVEEDALAELSALCRAVAASLRTIVTRYREDPRIAALLRLDPAVEACLAPAWAMPYSIGTYRPDFVIDEQGVARVCEINARFSANGFVISQLVDAALEGVSYLGSTSATFGPARPARVPGMAHLRDVLTEGLRDGRAIALVLASESGDEIHSLLSGIDVVAAAPEDLAISRGEVTARGRPVRSFVLELDRSELERIDPAVLDAMIRSGRCRNDVRTLSIVHDKRVLALLCDGAILRDHVDAGDRAILARHVIPTFPATDPAARESALEDREAWVLKPSHGGRGVGVQIGRETPRAAWETAVTTLAFRSTLQRFVPQRSFPILHVEEGELRETPMNIVGLLPCFERHVFGPGIFRASTASVINVHQRRGEVLPCAVVRGRGSALERAPAEPLEREGA